MQTLNLLNKKFEMGAIMGLKIATQLKNFWIFVSTKELHKS